MLSSILSNKEVFNQAKQPYQQAFDRNGYNSKLKFDPNSQTQPPKYNQRKHKFKFFNPHVKIIF